MEVALSYYLRAKREKLGGVFRLADQWVLWAPAAAGCFSGVSAIPAPALDSVCTWAAPSPWEQVRYTLLDKGSSLAALDPALCCWGLGLWQGGHGVCKVGVLGWCRGCAGAVPRPSQARLSERMVMGPRWW